MPVVCAVTTTIPTMRGAFVWYPVEFDVDDLQALTDRLVADDLVYGYRLELDPAQAPNGPRGPRTIVARTPIVVSRRGVVTITPIHLDLVDAAATASVDT